MAGQLWAIPTEGGYMYSDELSDVLRQQVQPLTKMRQLCDAEDGTKKGLNRGDKYNWGDYIMLEDGRAMGRIYEDRHTLLDLRWLWSITVYVDPKQGIITNGRAASLDEAKAQFLSNWQRCRADSTPFAQHST